jgi:hypothetical protein
MSKQLLLEKISKEEMIQHLKDYYKYAKAHLDIDESPKVVFAYDKNNANDFLGKTGHYDPKSKTIHLFIVDRHPKDIIRSFAHELIHHYQNLHERLPDEIMSQTKDIDYATKNKDLRDMEREAFEKGNMMFRDWTDSIKSKRSNKMDEKKEMTKSEIKKRDKLAKKIPTHTKKGKKVNPYAVATAAVTEELDAVGEEDKDVDNDGDSDSTDKYLKNRREKIGDTMGKTKERKLKEAIDLQTADPRLKEVFTQKERLMNDSRTNREQIVYNELMRRFLKQGK